MSDIKYVSWTFYRHVIPSCTCSRLVPRTDEKKKKKHGNTSSLLPFRGPVVGGGTFSRLLVAASQIGPEKKVAMSPSSTVHEGQYNISRVSVSWLIRAGGNPPPSQIPLAQSTHFGIIFSPTRNTFWRHGHFFLQDLGLALVTSRVPTDDRPSKRPKTVRRFRMNTFFPPFLSERGDCKYFEGYLSVFFSRKHS